MNKKDALTLFWIIIFFILIIIYSWFTFFVEYVSINNKLNAELTEKECVSFWSWFTFIKRDNANIDWTIKINCIDYNSFNENGWFVVKEKVLSVSKSYYYINKYYNVVPETINIYDWYVKSFKWAEIPDPYFIDVSKSINN